MKKALSEIPNSLWKNNVLYCEDSLVRAYKEELKELRLYKEACGNHVDAPGGQSDEATLSNFTHRFLSSTVRTEFLTLDPRNSFKKIQESLLTYFADGELAILDIPGGCSGGIMGIVSTIIELRRTAHLPMLPLNLKIVTGDISPKANQIYKEIFKQIESDLIAVGIRYQLIAENWNALIPEHTNRVLDRLFGLASVNSMHLLFVSAFSDFLHYKSNRKKFKGILDNVKTRFYERDVAYLHIESSENTSREVLKFLVDKLLNWTGVFSNIVGTEFQWLHPLKPDQGSTRGQLTFVLFERNNI